MTLLISNTYWVTRCSRVQYGMLSTRIFSKLKSGAYQYTFRSCNHVAGSEAKLVYKGPLTDLVRGGKMFSIASSSLAFSLQPFVLSSAMSGGTISTLGIVTAGLLGIFTVTTPIMLHVFTRQYVTHLYWHAPNKPHVFTAVSYNILARPKLFEFHRDEVTVPDIGGFLKSHSVRGRPLFLDSRMFTSDEAYVALMGYDKPMDWELPPDYRLGVRNPSEEQKLRNPSEEQKQTDDLKGKRTESNS